MSMEHKAFIFDYEAFELELKDVLETALDLNESSGLENFIKLNMDHLTDPYEGDRLTENWTDMLKYKDPHEYGDFALTKFYNPIEDIGLGYDWVDVEELLSSQSRENISILGNPIGKEDNYFDPGKMGSYFQSLSTILGNRRRIDVFATKEPDSIELLNLVTYILDTAISLKKGLYITF
jgi:hypothetical protein